MRGLRRAAAPPRILAPNPRSVTRIQPGSFLTLHYRLSNTDGTDWVNTFGGRPATLSLGTGQLSPSLEQRLIGLEEGARCSFDVPAGQAFGPRNPDLVQRMKLAALRASGDPDATYEPGDVVQFSPAEGDGSFSGLVREKGDDWLLIDFNHPLAGQPVSFEVEVIGVLD